MSFYDVWYHFHGWFSMSDLVIMLVHFILSEYIVHWIAYSFSNFCLMPMILMQWFSWKYKTIGFHLGIKSFMRLPCLCSSLPDLLVVLSSHWSMLLLLLLLPELAMASSLKEHLHFHHARLEYRPFATPLSSEQSPQAGTRVRAQSFVLGSWTSLKSSHTQNKLIRWDASLGRHVSLYEDITYDLVYKRIFWRWQLPIHACWLVEAKITNRRLWFLMYNLSVNSYFH